MAQAVIRNEQEEACINIGLTLNDINTLLRALRAVEDKDSDNLAFRLVGKKDRLVSAVMTGDVQAPHRSKSRRAR